jgi:hypothetical protein
MGVPEIETMKDATPVAAGLEFFFVSKGNTSVKDKRRKYLERNFDGPQGAGKQKPHSSYGCGQGN